MQRFSTAEGYDIYPDVLPFFRNLRHQRLGALSNPTERVDTAVGIISNSDDRVSSILESFGLGVSSRRYSPGIERDVLIRQDTNDFDFLTLSYDVGVAKPDRRIFDAARLCAATPNARPAVEHVYMHVGDDPVEDYHAAEHAGWKGACLGGHNRNEGQQPKDGDMLFFKDLSALHSYVWNDILV